MRVNQINSSYDNLSRFWKLGYGQEICGALIAHALDKMNLGAIAYVDRRSLVSVKPLEHLIKNLRRS